MKNIYIAFITFLGVSSATAQVGIGTSSPNTNAMLEVRSTTKGLLLPRVALTATNNPAPLSAHVAGMKVYNTATNSSVAANPVYPGEYYNDGTQWQRETAWNDTTIISGGTIGGDVITAVPLDVPASTTGGPVSSITLSTISFTLSKPSIVEFDANISAAFTNSGIAPGAAGAGITDNAVKISNIYYMFTAAPSGIPINTSFGVSSISYVNSFTTFVVTGSFYLVPRAILNLPAGSYTVTVVGAASSGTAFRVTYGGGTRDTINIRSTPTK